MKMGSLSKGKIYLCVFFFSFGGGFETVFNVYMYTTQSAREELIEGKGTGEGAATVILIESARRTTMYDRQRGRFSRRAPPQCIAGWRLDVIGLQLVCTRSSY